MSKVVAFNFLDKKNVTHRLNYEIYDSDLANRWLGLVKANKEKGTNYIHTSLMNVTEKNIDEVLKKTNQTIERINERYDRKLPIFPDVTYLDQNILNYLHEEYEIYGDRIDEVSHYYRKSNLVFLDLHKNFLALNELIHTCEIILDQRKDDFSLMTALFDYKPDKIELPVQEKDKLYLTNEFKWGKLYLGYNTLGKDWLEISNHNDLEVIEREQVRPQQFFSAEAWLYFASDSKDFINTIRFEKWYDSLSEEIKKQVPISNLNQLNLGRFEIGTLILDRQFLNFHDNKSDWKSHNHPVKDRWNRDIFSTYKKIISVEIVE